MTDTSKMWVRVYNQNIAIFKGAGRSADLKFSKSALLCLNQLNFWNTEPIYTKKKFYGILIKLSSFWN